MNISEWKQCNKCKTFKPLDEFHNKKGSPDGKSDECGECSNKRTRIWRKKRKYDPEYTLYVSCGNAWKRGQENYKEAGYEDVLIIGWDSFQDFYDCMLHDYVIDGEKFFDLWIKQNNIYQTTKQQKDRPSLGRIDHFGHYEEGNITCEPLGINNANGASKPIELIIMKNMRFEQAVLEEYNTLKEAKEALKQKGYPVNVLAKKIDVGKAKFVGNDTVLIQSKYGDLKQSDEPIYKLIIEHRKEKYDMETSEVIEVLERNQYQFNTGGIRFNKKSAAVNNAR